MNAAARLKLLLNTSKNGGNITRKFRACMGGSRTIDKKLGYRHAPHDASVQMQWLTWLTS